MRRVLIFICSGAYGAGVDIGSSGGVGLRCSALFADKRYVCCCCLQLCVCVCMCVDVHMYVCVCVRHHGKLLVDQETADQYCEYLASRHYMKVNDKHYDSIPVEARGIPHLAIPGLHSYLDEYYSGMMTLQRTTNPERCENGEYPTVQSMACLPFTPFAQALAPGTTTELDTTRHFAFRNRADQIDMDGRCFMNDGTVEDVAILKEPLFPRAKIADASDNPFELADDHMDTFFNAAATAAILIDVRFGECGPDFKRVIDAGMSFHSKRPVCEGMETMADLMVLFNSMYPKTFDVAQPHILSAYSSAPFCAHKAAKYQEKHKQTVEGLRLSEMSLPTKDVQEAQEYGERFFTMVFPELCPLIATLIHMNCRYDLTLEEFVDVSKKLDNAVKAAWFLQSPDGESPPEKGSPLDGVASPARVNAKHVAPRVVDREQSDGTWETARGALVGIMPGAYRQLMSLLVAASTMNVSVQVYRNIGGLLLRPSAAPDIVTKEGKQRSDKAISPLGVEGDQLAWGTREGKLRSCTRQRRAWKLNMRLIMDLCTNVSKPVPADEMLQADDSCVEYIRSRVASHGQVGTKTQEELDSLQTFNAAVKCSSSSTTRRNTASNSEEQT